MSNFVIDRDTGVQNDRRRVRELASFPEARGRPPAVAGPMAMPVAPEECARRERLQRRTDSATEDRQRNAGPTAATQKIRPSGLPARRPAAWCRVLAPLLRSILNGPPQSAPFTSGATPQIPRMPPTRLAPPRSV